jgi:hypothetical protein
MLFRDLQPDPQFSTWFFRGFQSGGDETGPGMLDGD